MEVVLFISVFLLSFASSSVIIPEELPSLLSVAYSNIPPIKKGTDSRVGFGFAFGNHADFQVMFELGPQTNTQNLTGQPFAVVSNKRQAPFLPPQKTNKNSQKLQSDGGNYLLNWAQSLKNPPKMKKPVRKPGEVDNLEDSLVELVQNEKGEYEIHQPKPGNMPQNVLDNLRKLYGQRKEESKIEKKAKEETKTEKRSSAEIKRITEDLSNVNLD